MEQWKYIPGFDEKYMVSSLGRIKSLFDRNQFGIQRRIKLMNPTKGNHGYFSVYLKSSSLKKRTLVHRLVASAFIPNTENKPQVNHINGIKLDNRIENLEWVTRSENIIHGFKNGLIVSPMKGIKSSNHSRAIKIVKISGATVKEFGCIKDACIYEGVSYSKMKKYLKGFSENNIYWKYF